MKKKVIGLITIIIVIAIIAGSVFLINSKKQEAPEETAKCIRQNSVLYTQLGCHACENQEKLFGESYQYLNIVDCFYESERQECINAGITATPTWVINGQKYAGVQSVERLKELAGC
ncbi:hypothetical protein A3K82_00135 [Candidatus Pacearchaeota archaeon RBG_19FT_COMBO_34_9]|nr:MAG: hypothetical protein A3K82_00135 [Candidatus Pacearchaeota archaeon RBG_19FT_COMBO_34_9]OGJ17322.1 MAG: hypothetical protein A3K74_01695 [Candidatus Pacearchaeota archaeon RBG_13_33_26]